MSEEIKGLQLELQDFIWEQEESNKRVEHMLEQLVDKFIDSDGLVRCEEGFDKRLEQVERVIMLLKTDIPKLTRRINDLDWEFTYLRNKQ